jgi:hypothetical protein
LLFSWSFVVMRVLIELSNYNRRGTITIDKFRTTYGITKEGLANIK